MKYIVGGYLALCVLCYSCRAEPTLNGRFGETEEIKVHQMFLAMLSCESLQSLGEQVALGVLEAEQEAKAAKLATVRKAWQQVRAERMQDLTDIDEEEHSRCGLERR